MPHAPFVHLHVHTCYSLLSSTLRPEDAIKKAKEFAMPALALTDQGNLFVAIQFYTKCLKAGIKPILGAQVFLVPDHRDRSARADREVRDQLILLCRDGEGWRSLMELLSLGYLEGTHGRPRVDMTQLRQHSRGLIALSGGPKGEVGRLLKENKPGEAREAARRLAELFGEEEGTPNFFLEVQRHGLPGEEELVNATVALAYELNLPLVASNDVHFLKPEDERAHDALVCVGAGQTLFQEERYRWNPRFAFLSPDEMVSLFADLPEAVENTLHIARRCNLRLTLGRPMLPDFKVPEGHTLESWIEHEAQAGLEMRLDEEVLPRFPPEEREETAQNYRQRLALELEIIIQMGFPGYFLIVSDFIRWAKEQGIPVGPGRGSGAGSVAAWALQITDLDPIRYQLLFERFLNPERVSMPDFDVDFCMDRREAVIHYVQDKYGVDHVAQIITFGSLQARAVIRDVGRVLEFPFGRVDRIAKLVPNVLGITLAQALIDEERLQQLRDDEEEVKELIDLALTLEGMPRSAGTHAAGVVISNGPLTATVPLYRDPRSDMPVTQFNMSDVEKAGLVKFDFLGLKTLTVIDLACKLANHDREKTGLPPIAINRIDLEDQATFRLLKEGKSRGVFQLESSGMREILKKLAPDNLEDVIALVALYRPGPLGSGMVDDFINRKHGRTAVVYPLPQLEPILKETYGVILYQEQVMKIAQVLAGYTLGGADLLRRAMGKKKPEEMAAQRAIFLEGSNRNNVDAKRAEYIFDLMEKFAGYGFNKSHSAAYALIAYQTAWLKAHYPVAFMAATLSCDMQNTDKVIQFIRECREMGIAVHPPDVNRSDQGFSVEAGGVRFGLGAVKNVGESAVLAMLRAREKGPFTSLLDLARRVDPGSLNRRVMESLIKAGACDDLGQGNRNALLTALPNAMSRGVKQQTEKSLGFLDLFGQDGGEERAREEALPHVPDLDPAQKLAYEKEVLGFYITGHPLQRYEQELVEYGLDTTQQIRDRALGDPFLNPREGDKPYAALVGLVAERKVLRTRKGDRMAFLTLEDMHGRLEVVVFPEVFKDGRELLEDEGPIIVEGAVEVAEETVKITAERLMSLDAFRRLNCRGVELAVEPLTLSPDVMQKLAVILQRHAGGGCVVFVELVLTQARVVLELGERFRVHPRDALLDELCELFGVESARFRGHNGAPVFPALPVREPRWNGNRQKMASTA